ncbi:MAG: hypothetical protein WBQ68_12535 [Terriglobales bacterium]
MGSTTGSFGGSRFSSVGAFGSRGFGSAGWRGNTFGGYGRYGYGRYGYGWGRGFWPGYGWGGGFFGIGWGFGVGWPYWGGYWGPGWAFGWNPWWYNPYWYAPWPYSYYPDYSNQGYNDPTPYNNPNASYDTDARSNYLIAPNMDPQALHFNFDGSGDNQSDQDSQLPQTQAAPSKPSPAIPAQSRLVSQPLT